MQNSGQPARALVFATLRIDFFRFAQLTGRGFAVLWLELRQVGVEQMRRIGERLGWYYAPTLRPSIGQSVFDAASGFHSAWEALTDPFHAGAQPRSALHERFRSLIAPVKEKVEVRGPQSSAALALWGRVGPLAG